MDETLYIGEIAELFGVSTKTLRHYEKLGLLEPRRAENDYRMYGPEDVLRVQRIRQLQSLGMSLQEIGRVLERQDDEALWTAVLRRLHNEVADEIASLEARRARLEELLAQEKPPAVEEVAPVPEKVNEYLEQHLPQASLQGWREEWAAYTLLDALLRRQTRAPFSRLQRYGYAAGRVDGYSPAQVYGNGRQGSNGAPPEELDTYYSGVRNVLAALREAADGPDEEETR